MDPTAPVIFILILILAIAAGLWLAWRRFGSLFTHPDMKAARKLGYFQRFRLGKLARSEQPISDPDERRKAEVVARSAMRALDLVYSPRQLLWIAAVVLLPLFIGERELWFVASLLGAVVLLGMGYISSRRMRAQIERTAGINGWDLEARGEQER